MRPETEALLNEFKLLCEDDRVWKAMSIFSILMDLPEEEREAINAEAQAVLRREQFQVIKGDANE